MLSDRAKVLTRREWQELGFYYDRDDENRSWRIVGAKSGLRKFADLLREYAADKRNQGVSEHEHFGPYSYLEIGTWDIPEITEHWIAGPLDRLSMLASMTNWSQRKRLSSGFPCEAHFLPRRRMTLKLKFDLKILIQPAKIRTSLMRLDCDADEAIA